MKSKKELLKMKNELLKALFERTYGGIKDRLGYDINEEQYYEYLSRRYSKRLSGSEFVDFCAEEEERRWQDIRESDMVQSILNSDEAFERLESLATQAMNEAYIYREHRETFHGGMKEYRARLKELTECMYKIQPYNITMAKRLLLDAVLDLNFLFRRSNFDSKELNKITQQKRL